MLQYLILYGSYAVFFFIAYLIYRYKKLNKKDRLAAVILIFISAIFIYARFIEPNIIIVKNHSIDIEKTAGKNIKIAVFSDAHIGIFRNEKILKRVVEKINLIHPNLVLIPGDFVYKINKNNIESALAPLSGLKAPAFAVTGNHDTGSPGIDVSEEIKIVLEKYNIKFIDNNISEIKINGQQIEIIGLSDIWGGKTNFDLLNKISDKKLTIVLTHNPDSIYQFPKTNIDLVVAGHTHGGQIRLPFVYKYAIPSEYGFDKGFYYLRGMNIFVSPGLGMAGLPFRFLMPPEVDILNIEI